MKMMTSFHLYITRKQEGSLKGTRECIAGDSHGANIATSYRTHRVNLSSSENRSFQKKSD